MALAYFGHTAQPLDNDATGDAGATVTVVPPASMAANDIVAMWAGYKSTSTSITLDITVTGNQTWTSHTHNYGGSTSSIMGRLFTCKFDGTWTADPVITISSLGTSPMSAIMVVFRGANTTTWIDAAEQRTANAAPATPFTMSIPEITTATNGAMAVAHWFTGDDNSMASLTSGWANPNSETQWRNLSGADCSMGVAYKIITTAGGSGAVSVVQSVITGDTWNSSIVAIRPAAAAGVPIAAKSYYFHTVGGMR